MRLDSLALERYGAFTDRVLSFAPDAALHIVHGANESGKTSALSAIGDLLFGFGARTAYNFRHDNNALRIGGILRHSDGRQLAIRRRKGNKNTLLDDADKTLPDDTLTPWLGGIARDTFDREFGLTAESLRRGGDDLLRAGGRLAETLAASSSGMSALTQLKERLQREADDLFTPRRSGGKAFYIAVDRREAAERALRDSIVTREALRQADDAVRDAEAQLASLNAAHSDSGKALARGQRTLRVRSRLARLDEIARARTALADLPAIAPATLTEWRDAVAADIEIARERAALAAADEAGAAEIAALAVNEALLSEQAAVEALRDRMGAIRKDFADLPRRRQARETAQAALDDGARRLGIESGDALLQRLPSDTALARAHDLIARRRQTEAAITEAESRVARAQREHDDFAIEHADAPAISDPAALKQRFDALGDIATQADRLRRERATLALERDALAASLRRLDPSPGPLDGLRELPLPDMAQIERFARDVAGNDDVMERLATALAAQDDAIAAVEADLRQLSSAGTTPGRADLAEARRQRDTSLGALREALDGDRARRDARFGEVVRASQTIDGITDLLLNDTERATRREDAGLRLATHRTERERIAAKRAEAAREHDALDQAWRGLWTAARLTPRAPAEMQRWRERADDILQRLAKLDALASSLDALEAHLDAGKSATVAFLESLGRTPDRTLAADILHREAALRLDELRAAWADAKARAVNRQRIARDLREAEAARDAAQRALAQVQQAWPGAMAGIAVASKATAAETEAALAVWQSVAVPKASFERESRSVLTMEADIAAFEADVRALAERIAPQAQDASALDTLPRLCALLDATRRAADARRRLQDAATQRALARRDLAARHAATAALIERARAMLNCPDIDALRNALNRIQAGHALAAEQADITHDLAETADGRDEAALRQEREGVDLDLLPGDIAREQVRQTQLLHDIATASATLQQRRTERDALLKGRDAAAAATERAEADTELLAVSQRWLLRAAAARLAARAIERHRARVQDPLIARAGELFAAASDAAFDGLAIDYGDDDQPELKARRGSGERVGIAGLSEGSRDQLFLALRLALLERHGAEPMPFIGDDLLSSFDEARTLATLRLLAAGGRARQIILFTHHRHVVDLARTVSGHRIDCVAL